MSLHKLFLPNYEKFKKGEIELHNLHLYCTEILELYYALLNISKSLY